MDDRRRRGRDMLTALKESGPRHESALCIPVGRPVRALLRPLSTRRSEIRPADVDLIAEWRNRFVTAFLTEFDADHESTERWLAEVIHPDPSRMLFMLDEIDGRSVGQMGLASIDWASGSFEIDSIARGEPGARGLMAESIHTMMRWAQSQLALTDAWLRVRSDNDAIGFYERIGFSETRRVPLRRESDSGHVRWIEAPGGGDDLDVVYMAWTDPLATEVGQAPASTSR